MTRLTMKRKYFDKATLLLAACLFVSSAVAVAPAKAPAPEDAEWEACPFVDSGTTDNISPVECHPFAITIAALFGIGYNRPHDSSHSFCSQSDRLFTHRRCSYRPVLLSLRQETWRTIHSPH